MDDARARPLLPDELLQVVESRKVLGLHARLHVSHNMYVPVGMHACSGRCMYMYACMYVCMPIHTMVQCAHALFFLSFKRMTMDCGWL